MPEPRGLKLRLRGLLAAVLTVGHSAAQAGGMTPCGRCMAPGEHEAATPFQPNLLASRPAAGPACLGKLLPWRGRPNTDGPAWGLVDKVYVIHYSRVSFFFFFSFFFSPFHHLIICFVEAGVVGGFLALASTGACLRC